MTLPSGPDVVGLAPIVLPARGKQDDWGSAAEEPTWTIWAPRCRYGEALYASVIVDDRGEHVQAHLDDAVESGGSTSISVGLHFPKRIELHVLKVSLSPRALENLSTTELLEALSHPLVNVREAALLALGR